MDREELARLYQEVGTLSRLGNRLGLSIGGARGRLLAAGIPIQDQRRRHDEAAGGVTTEEGEEWKRRYVVAGSVTALAREMGKHPQTIRYHLRKHGVPIRSTGFAAPRTVPTATGADHGNWKGGLVMHSDGYITEYAPWHPAASGQKGYVLQHRLVMEKTLGRFLTSDELVHHKNEDKADNRPENLEVTTRSHHMSHHKDGFPRDELGRFSY